MDAVKRPIPTYSAKEERINALTHGIGAVLALAACVLLLLYANQQLSTGQYLGLLVYGISLVVLFSASTLYHAAQSDASRAYLKKLDHSAIYLLIAGTYTPFLMIALNTTSALLLLWALWILALLGVLFKLWFVHRFEKLSLITYLLMGWLAVFVLPDIYHSLSPTAFKLLVAGGLSYTIGTLFYAAKKIPYTHAIWHIFVLMGAACHWYAIFKYVAA